MARAKKVPRFEHQTCYSCKLQIGAEARCLGCGRSSYPCPEHWPRFTACSPACLPPHRKKLDKILREPLSGEAEFRPGKKDDRAPWPKVR